ncbi:MAG: hypothetical protein MAGBODY4_01084 [Candidatus Marinimicrobia bacterium]|nr:hypothetical protein [Candidatus Neomarinimicrobiota bacterium]
MFSEVLSSNAKKLMQDILPQEDTIREKFYLAGGTGLALHLGHRKSEDLDFICKDVFPLNPIARLIDHLDGQLLVEEKDTVHAIINDVKISFLWYPYEMLSPFDNYGKIRVAGVDDIACMKCIAISQRGAKKDYYDLYEILRLYSLRKMRDMLEEKYGLNNVNIYHIGKSLLYFDEAEKTPEPVIFRNLKWEEVKTSIQSFSDEITQVFLEDSRQ